MRKVPSCGPYPSDIMIVGEAPGVSEEMRLLPFIGSSGMELTHMLSEAGINREACFITNVCKYRPPKNDIKSFFPNKTEARKRGLSNICGRYPNEQIIEGLGELYQEIDICKPKVIVALGDTALWALCGESGISKWRGSTLMHEGIPVVPTYHPAAILRQWSWRFITVNDLRKVKMLATTGTYVPPRYGFIIRPNYTTVIGTLEELLKDAETDTLRLACDIETRFRHIECFGIAWTKRHAICIPFLTNENRKKSYWTIDEETQIVWKLRQLLTHPNVQIIGQNWNYDSQYTAKDWGFIAWPFLDTMLAHHVAFAGLPKALDFQASLYNDDYTFWKEEGHQESFYTMDLEQHWTYNCKDCVNTFEASYHIEDVIRKFGLEKPLAFQMSMVKPVLKTMLRGVLVDREARNKISLQLLEAMIDRQNFLNAVLGRNFNPRSTTQMKALFYTQLGVKPILNRKTKKPTLAKGALKDLRKHADPIIHPIIDAIIEFRRAGTANSVATVSLDLDGRIRSSYNLAGTETYRLASSEDAFGFGTNLQNISKGD